MIDNLTDRYHNVCAAPGGNGFRVEHMPQLFESSDIDDNAPHVHNFYEILWFQEGEGCHTVDFVEYKIRPNTFFFLSPGQIHNFDPTADKSSYKGLAIKMCTDFLRDEECSDNTMLKYNAFHTFDTSPYMYVEDSVAKELLSIVAMMESEAAHRGQFGNIDILKSLLRIFLVKIQRYGVQEGGVQLDSRKSSHLLFVRFRQLVDRKFRTLHTVQQYADALNVALRTLGKSVSECSGRSPLSFINDRIILEAKRLVRHSNLMIKEIAYELGFEDPSYFVKLFKRQTGYLPSDFREMDQVDKAGLRVDNP